MKQRLFWILWPSFLAAAGAEFVFFALFDPSELHFLGRPLDVGRSAAYTIGFFGFWALAAASSILTLFLREGARSPPT